MNRFGQCVLVGVIFFQSIAAFADDVITNIMSPIVSFQYPNDLSGEALTNGGIQSPIVSYQYYEWPGDGILNLQSSPTVSYYYQPFTSQGPVSLYGHIIDINGLALSNVTVSALVFLTSLARTTTDGSGNYQFSALTPGVYGLQAAATPYATSTRVLTLNANTSQQDFQLSLLPAIPVTQQVIRDSTVNYTSDHLMCSQLLIYNGSSFVPITNNLPLPNLMTIVMTHGWIFSSPDSSVMGKPYDRWPTNIAPLLQSCGITPQTANIMAWDWRYAATSLDVGIPADRTAEQGVALGEALQTFLGQNYSKPLHFLGHSLGTLVNASAINYLHGEQIGTRNYSPTPWKTNLVHVTLFDQAQLAEYMGFQPNYQSALPLNFTLADNYKSLVGLGNLPGAINADLQKGALTALSSTFSPMGIADDSHGYAINWYGMSIRSPSDSFNPLGFKRSYEYAPSLFPPTDIPLSTTYHQSPFNFDELALEPLSLISSFGLLPDVAVQTAVDTIQYTGGVSVQIGDSVENDVSSLFGSLSSNAVLGEQAVINLFDSTTLVISLTTVPPLVQNSKDGFVPRPLTPAPSTNALGSPPMVWIPIQIPTDATAMTFDFLMSGDPEDDTLVCGIGTNNLFSQAAKYIPSNQFSATRLIAISQWAGTANELFFGFMGGTSTNATLQIQNIRFYSLVPPQLAIAMSGNTTSLKWPLSTGNYSLLTSTNFFTSNWATITNNPIVVNSEYVLTNSWTDQMRFFLLQPQ